MNYSAADLAERLAHAAGTPPQLPTEEQIAVIEAPTAPTLVVAGAGSGKTHTMAQRVLWLVANEVAQPDEVLGLTFTRKAARELADRLDQQLALLADAQLVPVDVVQTRKPSVQTYNSFAGSLFKEWALLIGRDPDSEVLSDPAALLMALRIARASDDERLATIGSATRVAEHVLRLAGELGDHHVSTERLRRAGFADAFAAKAALPPDPSAKRALAQKAQQDFAADVARVGALAPLSALVDAFDEQKRRLGVVQFSDQVRFALDALLAHDGAIEELRDRHRFVLLDEFQDTSVLQLELLGRIFRERPVMAVGDPNQAIYGFRGASAGTLALFQDHFGATAKATLSISWRNDAEILTLAGAIAAELPIRAEVPVEPLRARGSAGPGEVVVRHCRTVDDEADELTAWLVGHGAGQGATTAAVLVRTHGQAIDLSAALAARGLTVSRSGGGGLFEDPAVVDLIAALRVLGRPEEGSSLVRLLAGSRWRIGVADLMALQRSAQRMAKAGLTDEQRARDRGAVVAEASSSIVDALDALVDGAALEGATDEGGARMRQAATLLRELRRQAGMPLPDYVRAVERALRLDIEVGANPNRSNAALDAFAREVQAFASADERGTLDALLTYLEAVDRGRGPDAPQEEPKPGIVQVLTMHASKGLEWDVVALPRLAQARRDPSTRGWLDWGKLPFPLRGDAKMLPVLDHDQPTVHDYLAARGEFLADLASHAESEGDRLSYVAVTRARRALWLSGAQWYGTGTTPAKPTRLLELAAATMGTELLDPASKEDGNPRAGSSAVVTWPVDPLGRRRPEVERAAALVDAADPAQSTPWDDVIDLLLADRAPAPLTLPSRVAASGFKDWAADPVEVAKQLARPMPQQPFAATRLGTLFHGWVERRDGAIGLGDAVDDEALDEELVGIDAERLERLKQTFLASPYGDRQPAETEIEIHLPLAGTTVVCKIDAVYRDGDRATVVDWKTGRLPSGAADLEARQLQLALYRAAYAAHAGLEPELVDAELYFVEHDRIVRPERIESLAELEARWLAAQQAVAEASAVG
ncbi:ATP-dependent DNA helicase [Agrococcus sp. ProA11]|uniref:ATP-dependent DNA helicase n=1 Tax=Agrococcus chionoecetis TaxID=3153752 RepID=UPI0032607EC3